MMMKNNALLALASTVVLASCGGGSGASVPAPSQSPRATAPASLAIVIPLRAPSSQSRHVRFVSGATLSGTVTVNAAPTTQTLDLSPGAPGCSQTSSARTCTVSVNLPLGSDTVALSTYDGPVSGGHTTGKLLAQAQVTQTIQEGAANAIVITLLGVPAAVVLQLDNTAPPVGTPATLQLTAKVYDLDGYQITSDPYLTPVTVSSDDTSGQVTLDKATLSNPADVITVHYSGKLVPKPITFSVSSPVQSYPPGSQATLAPNPFTTYGPIANPNVNAIASGPDGNIWFTECAINGPCKLGKITPSGTITEFADVPFANGLVAGPDGNVWFTEGNKNFLGRITPSGTVSQFAIPSGQPSNGDTVGPIVVGPDGNIWFAEGDRIGVSTTAGAITEYTIGGLFRPSSIVAGTDGALWFSEGQQIGRITTAGVVTQFPVDNSGFHSAGPLVFGPSNTMYFSASYPGSGPIWSMTTGGVVNKTSLLPAGVSLYPVLGTGPDGNMWGGGGTYDPYGYAQGGGIVRATFAGATTTYLTPGPPPFGSTVGISHGAFGPDGNLWFADGQGLARFRIAP
jgi:streptogramin lyase